MARKRRSEEEIIKIIKQVESGRSVEEVCREKGISESSYYKWKSKFGGMEVNEAKRLRSLEDENRRLKQMVADQALDLQVLKVVLEKKW